MFSTWGSSGFRSSSHVGDSLLVLYLVARSHSWLWWVPPRVEMFWGHERTIGHGWTYLIVGGVPSEENDSRLDTFRPEWIQEVVIRNEIKLTNGPKNLTDITHSSYHLIVPKGLTKSMLERFKPEHICIRVSSSVLTLLTPSCNIQLVMTQVGEWMDEYVSEHSVLT